MAVHESDHYGGQMGLAAFVLMLGVTSCAALLGGEPDSRANWLPGWTRVERSAQDAILAQARTDQVAAATFIVRFHSEPAVDEICRSFRRDNAAARSRYAAWSSQYPQLSGLSLVGASYSGEMILGIAAGDARRSPSQILADLQSMGNVAYADIDAIAQPGTGN